MHNLTVIQKYKMIFVVLKVIFVLVVLIPSSADDYFDALKQKFEGKFMNTCSKYSFVHKYLEIMTNPTDQYFIYVFHDDGKGKHTGGLGDRLAGIVTAVAYAIRSNRNFLIQGDESFEKTFQPYHTDSSRELSWGNWEHSGWSREFASNMTQLRCHNPKSSRVYCALDHPQSQNQFKVIKYTGNRSYLCRWLVKEDLQLRRELESSLGITIHSNLYEVAGCLLRLALHPTSLLWEEVHKQLLSMNERMGEWKGTQMTTVGVHFRCGDNSFASPNSLNSPNSPSPCVHHPNTTWNGTVFVDELSLDSPLQMAACARRLLTTAKHSQQLCVALVASDNPLSAKQIEDTMAWEHTLHPPHACHIDLQKSLQCSLSTLAQWFLLAQSDFLVTQSMTTPIGESTFLDTSQFAYLRQPLDHFPPISAFSRFAGIYGLLGDNLLNGQCLAASTTAASHYSHGNWVCNPKTFY